MCGHGIVVCATWVRVLMTEWERSVSSRHDLYVRGWICVCICQALGERMRARERVCPTIPICGCLCRKCVVNDYVSPAGVCVCLCLFFKRYTYVDTTTHRFLHPKKSNSQHLENSSVQISC